MVQKADVVVIGGGIMGCAIAYGLKKKGAGRVVLVERRGIGEETSSACDGGVNLQTKAPGPALKLAKRSVELYQTLSQELDYDVHFEKYGGMVMVDSPDGGRADGGGGGCHHPQRRRGQADGALSVQADHRRDLLP